MSRSHEAALERTRSSGHMRPHRLESRQAERREGAAGEEQRRHEGGRDERRLERAAGSEMPREPGHGQQRHAEAQEPILLVLVVVPAAMGSSAR